ncbi:MAG: hypothetical protein ACRECA_13305 [Pseudolabrys sp.]
MVPKLELDDVAVGGQLCHVVETTRDDDARTAILDCIHVAAVARLFEKNEGLLDFCRQDGTKRRMSFADAAAKMRRDVQNLHSAATTERL